MTDITQQHIAVLVKRLRTTVMPRRTSPQDKAIIDNLMDAADMLEQLAAERAKPADATPRAYLYRYSNPFTGKPVWRRDGELWNGQRPQETLPLYEHPAPDARTYADGVRDAAEVADYYAEMDYGAMHYPEEGAIAAGGTAHQIRQDIRALLTEKPHD